MSLSLDNSMETFTNTKLMSHKKACYRKLKKYKYQLMEDYPFNLNKDFENDVKTDFIELYKNGDLLIKKGYAWDGPSGPTIDTKNFMRASLIHDSLYQLMRDKQLDYNKHRKMADEFLKKICIEDGMWKIRANIAYRFVRWFGKYKAIPSLNKPDKIICVPES